MSLQSHKAVLWPRVFEVAISVISVKWETSALPPGINGNKSVQCCKAITPLHVRSGSWSVGIDLTMWCLRSSRADYHTTQNWSVRLFTWRITLKIGKSCSSFVQMRHFAALRLWLCTIWQRSKIKLWFTHTHYHIVLSSTTSTSPSPVTNRDSGGRTNESYGRDRTPHRLLAPLFFALPPHAPYHPNSTLLSLP